MNSLTFQLYDLTKILITSIKNYYLFFFLKYFGIVIKTSSNFFIWSSLLSVLLIRALVGLDKSQFLILTLTSKQSYSTSLKFKMVKALKNKISENIS